MRSSKKYFRDYALSTTVKHDIASVLWRSGNEDTAQWKCWWRRRPHWNTQRKTIWFHCLSMREHWRADIMLSYRTYHFNLHSYLGYGDMTVVYDFTIVFRLRDNSGGLRQRFNKEGWNDTYGLALRLSTCKLSVWVARLMPWTLG